MTRCRLLFGLLLVSAILMPGGAVRTEARSAPRLFDVTAAHGVDERYMKLDGGDPFTLRTINGTRVTIDAIVDGLPALGPLTLQSMFVADAAGRVDNVGEGAVNTWLGSVERVRPMAVQLYTLGREAGLSSLRPVSTRRLREIAERVRASGIPADVFAGRRDHDVGTSSRCRRLRSASRELRLGKPLAVCRSL
jgi:hypothetical protein